MPLYDFYTKFDLWYYINTEIKNPTLFLWHFPSLIAYQSVYIFFLFLLDLRHQVQLKTMGQNQKNKNHTKKKGKRKKRINLRKENIIKRRKRRNERKKVRLLIVQTVLVVTEVLTYFCVQFCGEDDFPFKSNLFMLCNAVVLKWDRYIFLRNLFANINASNY